MGNLYGKMWKNVETYGQKYGKMWKNVEKIWTKIWKNWKMFTKKERCLLIHNFKDILLIF